MAADHDTFYYEMLYVSWKTIISLLRNVSIFLEADVLYLRRNVSTFLDAYHFLRDAPKNTETFGNFDYDERPTLNTT